MLLVDSRIVWSAKGHFGHTIYLAGPESYMAANTILIEKETPDLKANKSDFNIVLENALKLSSNSRISGKHT